MATNAMEGAVCVVWLYAAAEKEYWHYSILGISCETHHELLQRCHLLRRCLQFLSMAANAMDGAVFVVWLHAGADMGICTISYLECM